MKTINIKVNIVLNVIRNISGMLFPIITYPYILRVLQVENVGKYNFSASIISYFTLIAGLGISTYAIREGIQYRNSNEKMIEFSNAVFSVNLLSTMISYFSLALFMFTIPQFIECSIYIFVLSGEILFSALEQNWIFNIYEDFLFIAIQTLVLQLISLLCIFTFVRNEDDLLLYCIFLTSVKIISHIVGMIYVRKKYCRYIFMFSCKLVRHIKPIIIIFFLNIAVVIYVNSDITMLGLLTNDFQVGLYSMSAKIYSIIKNILAAMLMVLIPRFSMIYKNNEYQKAGKLFVKVFNILTVLLLPVATGLFMMSDKIIYIFAGESYLAGDRALKILCLAIAFSLYAYMFIHCALIPTERETCVLIATAVSAVVNISLNYILIPYGGIDAAAFTTVLAEVCVWIMAMIGAKDIIRLRGVWRNLIEVILGCISIMLLCYLLRMCINDNIMCLCISILSSLIVYIFTLITMGNDVMCVIIKAIRKINVNETNLR